MCSNAHPASEEFMEKILENQPLAAKHSEGESGHAVI